MARVQSLVVHCETSRREWYCARMAPGETHVHRGLFSLKSRRREKLPSGLQVEITCERVATGAIHFSLTHDRDLMLAGTYSGPFTVRMFPPGEGPVHRHDP